MSPRVHRSPGLPLLTPSLKEEKLNGGPRVVFTLFEEFFLSQSFISIYLVMGLIKAFSYVNKMYFDHTSLFTPSLCPSHAH